MHRKCHISQTSGEWDSYYTLAAGRAVAHGDKDMQFRVAERNAGRGNQRSMEHMRTVDLQIRMAIISVFCAMQQAFFHRAFPFQRIILHIAVK